MYVAWYVLGHVCVVCLYSVLYVWGACVMCACMCVYVCQEVMEKWRERMGQEQKFWPQNRTGTSSSSGHNNRVRSEDFDVL